MRLPLIPPHRLTPEQASLYADMKAGINDHLTAFRSEDADGALVGPWSAWLHEPAIGGAIWNLAKLITVNATVSEAARQIVILAVGGHFNAAYEIYAHTAIAKSRGVTDERLASLAAGSRPADLNTEEACAFDLAWALLRGGVLPEPCYARSVAVFGQHGTNELIYLAGVYCLVSMTLNGFNVPAPEIAEREPHDQYARKR